MEAFRSQGLKTAVYGTVVLAVAVVFVIQFNPAQQKGGASLKNECAAQVRGRCVSGRDFRTTLSIVVGGRDEAWVKQSGVRQKVLDGLVERELLVMDAGRLGLRISDDELSAELRSGAVLFSLPAAELYDGAQTAITMPTKVDGKFDEKTYNKSLRSYVGRSQQEFREMQELEHVAARMRDVVRARVRVGEGELFDVYASQKTTASFRYVKLSRGFFTRRVDVGKAAIAAYQTDHKAELDAAWESRKSQYLPECRRARHILVKVDHTAKDEERALARKKIEDARARVTKKSEPFEAVAREVSDDTSAWEGGDLGCFQKGRMVKPFEDAVFAMKPGDVSDVIETEYGFHVIKLEAIRAGADAEADGRAQLAKERIRAAEVEAKTSELGKALLEQAAAGKPLDEALASLLAPFDQRPGADEKKKDAKEADKPAPRPEPDRPVVETARDATATKPPAGLSPDDAAALFALEKPGAVPPSILRGDDGYVVAQLIEKKAATRDEFLKERDKDPLLRQMQAAKRRDALLAYVHRLRDAAKAETKINHAYLESGKAPGEDGE
ncbi:MAG: peptidylprolyl isomerase [Polyangiaceae bacterium]|nr:peptidylprolyl isomerase [Polyangiaceae bacterium]